MLVGSISGVRRTRRALKLGDSSGVVVLPAFDPANTSPSVTLSENNARMTSSATDKASRSVQSKSAVSGNSYFEVMNVTVNAGTCIGVCNALASMEDWIGSTDRTLGVNAIGGEVFSAGGGPGFSGVGAIVAGDVVGVCLNRSIGKVWFSKNGAFGSGQDPVANTGGFTSPGGADIYAAVSNSAGGSARLRTLASQFSYAIPSGYVAWDTSSVQGQTWDASASWDNNVNWI